MKGPFDPAAVAIALAVTVLGFLGAGNGFLNGDAAVYAAQAGDLHQRTVHLGWIAIVTLLEPLGTVWLDRVVALFAGALVLGSGTLSHRWGRPAWTGALIAAVAVLPWASFAEVDLPWLALVVWAAAVTSPVLCTILLGLAVTVSPVALLALPWLWTQRAWQGSQRPRRPWLLLGAGFAVLGLTLFSGGDWWLGERGVLKGPDPRPFRVLLAWLPAAPWASLPLAVLGALAAGAPGLAACLPLLLAPADVPTVVLPMVSLSLAFGAGVQSLRVRPLWMLLLLGTVLDGGRAVRTWQARGAQVQTETAQIHEALASLNPEDGLVAPWTWGVRASVLATGDPYVLPWRVPGDPVRDQVSWCDRGYDRILLLPADQPPPPGWAPQEGWVSGQVAREHPLPGCEIR